MTMQALLNTINEIVAAGKGILAADESVPTMTKRLTSIDVESTAETRRSYRELLFTTPGLNEYISGVILFEETLGQRASDGSLLAEVLQRNGIVPGIKVDKGLVPLVGTDDEKVTQGLDGLPERLAKYKEMGARFAKWRNVYRISAHTPTRLARQVNADNLARYAAICQSQGIVPIVEPEVLLDGSHSIERCAAASEMVFTAVFSALRMHKVSLEGIILKPSMVVSGKEHTEQASIQRVAEETLKVLLRTVPAAVPTINFLSGGQTPEAATAHLQLMNELQMRQPWNLSYSYGRALQEPALNTWRGKAENIEAAQNALYKRAKLNSAAVLGQYSELMEA